ncbi:hypothetical protein [Methylobacterium crusticola]|uniref:hypothetical protein n=1 Tax=Methylobacterium crusticola TaxID=1697972 RepID=UPI000FFBFEC9|nr:hypothetical protein [Methylobacterium crusticola]
MQLERATREHCRLGDIEKLWQADSCRESTSIALDVTAGNGTVLRGRAQPHRLEGGSSARATNVGTAPLTASAPAHP